MLLASLLLMLAAPAGAASTQASGAATALPSGAILIASDSTAADADPKYYPMTGWGTMLRCGVAPGLPVHNFAMGGRSTKTFISEGRWDGLMATLKPGDTVLIQFGHNDASRDRPARFARAWTDYRDNLLRFVWMVRGARGVPVLLTPVTRRSFSDSGKAKADFIEYSEVVREVAEKTGTPLIDLESLSGAWIEKVGVEPSRSLYMHFTAAERLPNYPKGISDDTHFNEVGARGVADLVAGALKSLNLPVSARIMADRPDLARTTPVGQGRCH